jgi:class 3 adenylate cyclase/uncharacterized protein HemY
VIILLYLIKEKNIYLFSIMKSLANFILIILLSFSSIAQQDFDSLWGVWNDESAAGKERIKALQYITTYGYLYSRPDSAYYFAQLMLELAQEYELEKEVTMALNIQGGSYLVRGQFEKALGYYKRSLAISEKISDKKGMSKTLNNMGVSYSNLGNYPKALDYHLRSLIIKEELNDKSGMAGSMNNIGLIYMNQGNYPRALDYFQRSLNIMEDFADKRGIAQTLNNIGLIYMRQEDYANALDCFRRSLQICEEITDQKASAGILSNIGLIYTKQEEYAKALDHYQRSLEIQEVLTDRKGIASNYNNIGEIYSIQGNLDESLQYFEKSIAIYEEISDKQGVANVSINIGSVKNGLGNYGQALQWCSRGLKLAEEINVLNEQKNACQCLYDAYKAAGDNNKALKYHERIALLNDSLQAEETAKKLQQMEFSRQMVADSLIREKEKLRVQMAHDAEVRKKSRARNIFIISAIFLFLGAIALYWRVRYIRKAKKAVEKEKDRSDNLLLNILPAEIAQELKEKGKADARKFENVSILFTDFKEFTKIAEQLSAEELVGEINSCFESFDNICKKYGIEKIKTIGDSYMAAGGLPILSEDSVKNTVLAGLEMMACMINKKQEKKAPKGTVFEMRVGIHTGDVIAGIVGVTKFQYDIWGDTVNTASRVENAGEAGKVNISQSTYKLIKNDPQFKFHYRGKISTKGKGEMEMWFVEKIS